MSTAPVTQHRFHENGQKIRRARERVPSPRDSSRPISQQDFAPVLGISRRHVIRLENGEQLPSGSLRDRIVEASGTEECIESDDDEEEDMSSVLIAVIKRQRQRRRATGDPYAMGCLK